MRAAVTLIAAEERTPSGKAPVAWIHWHVHLFEQTGLFNDGVDVRVVEKAASHAEVGRGCQSPYVLEKIGDELGQATLNRCGHRCELKNISASGTPKKPLESWRNHQPAVTIAHQVSDLAGLGRSPASART